MAVSESTGNLWVRIYDLLRDRGVDVKLANPLKTMVLYPLGLILRFAINFYIELGEAHGNKSS